VVQAAAGVVERVRPDAGLVQPVSGQVWDAGSVELATWIISEANQQATEIRHEARDDAATSLRDAKQEAAKLMQAAAVQAAATIREAELQAARVRAEVLRLSAELGGMASYVTENLLTPARPVDKLVAAPAASSLAEPAVRPKAVPVLDQAVAPAVALARPAARPNAKLATAPAAAPALAPAKPGGRSRQAVAIRVTAAATTALVGFAVVTGVTEVVLHGARFFVFRSVGAGETSSSAGGLNENQGPGQADAPRAHIPRHQK
jgi:hypothetical protein